MDPSEQPRLSVVVPCYNEEKALPFFYEALVAVDLGRYTLELVLVDDGSTDGTLEQIRALQARDPHRVTYVSFSRNFGKEAALLAGLRRATGALVAVMDADLQDPPSLLPEMVRAIDDQGYDCVATRRVDRRGEPPLRSFFARAFYRLINRISDTEMVDGVRDFRLMTRQVTDAVLELAEYNRFSKGLFSWVGFKVHYVEYQNVGRVAGETKWSFWGLLRYSLQGIVNFSTFPLVIATGAGIVAFLGAIVGGLVIFVRTLLFGNPTPGWTSISLLILFIGGVQLLALGVIGEYVGKIFLETKNRPAYVVKEGSVPDTRSTSPVPADRWEELGRDSAL